MNGTTVDGETRRALREAVRRETRRPAQDEVLALVEELRDRFGAHFRAALYYGSCRRQTEIEGLVDLHVLIDDPVAALGPVAGRLCALLPPNVHYLEVEHAGRRVRCKYAVLGLDRFRRLSTRRAFHSYFWGRYAQPLTVLGAEAVLQEAIEETCVDALATFASRAVTVVDAAHGRDLWAQMLALSYGCELRPEGVDRARTLVDAQGDYYDATGTVLLGLRTRMLAFDDRRSLLLGWRLRAIWGKAVSLARLLKALQTFDGGLDYAAWKLERHTGRPVPVPDAVRRRPWLRLWPHLWRLWREGTLR